MQQPDYMVFAGHGLIAAGTLPEVALAAGRAQRDAGPAGGPVLVFDRDTGAPVDLDLRGADHEIAARYPMPVAAPKRVPGRPKLGVVAREITLLPRHWDWLAAQPGGTSVVLRRLVDAARRDEAARGGQRTRIDAAYRFMSTIAGDLPRFEQAARALFALDRDAVQHAARDWPADIRAQLLSMLDRAPLPPTSP